MTIPMRHAPAPTTAPEVLVCVLTVPVLSGTDGEALPAPAVVEVYASMRPRHAAARVETWDGSSPIPAIAAPGRSAQALSGAWDATRAAAREASLARRGTVPCAQARAASVAAEVARVAAAEEAIAAALAEGERLAARIAELDLARERAEMHASVASLLMTHDAQPGIADLSRTPMFTLVHDADADGMMRAPVFEEDLMRLVSGQDVALEAGPEGPILDLRARLGRAWGAPRDPSRVVRGAFLLAEMPADGAAAIVAVEARAGAPHAVG